MADGSILTLLIGPAVVGGAVAAILGPVLTALNARKLWVFQQKLDVYAAMCDYVVRVDRVTMQSRLVSDPPPMLPVPPDLLSGRVSLLASRRVAAYWRQYREAVSRYNQDVTRWRDNDSTVDDHGRYIAGLNMTSTCTEEMGVREPWRDTESARRWSHRRWRAGLLLQGYWWKARAPLRWARKRMGPGRSDRARGVRE